MYLFKETRDRVVYAPAAVLSHFSISLASPALKLVQPCLLSKGNPDGSTMAS